MNKNGNDEDKPKGQVTRIEDFLPPPSQLIPRKSSDAMNRAYAKMADDEQEEAEALEWIEAVFGDIQTGWDWE